MGATLSGTRGVEGTGKTPLQEMPNGAILKPGGAGIGGTRATLLVTRGWGGET